MTSKCVSSEPTGVLQEKPFKFIERFTKRNEISSFNVPGFFFASGAHQGSVANVNRFLNVFSFLYSLVVCFAVIMMGVRCSLFGCSISYTFVPSPNYNLNAVWWKITSSSIYSENICRERKKNENGNRNNLKRLSVVFVGVFFLSAVYGKRIKNK